MWNIISHSKGTTQIKDALNKVQSRRLGPTEDEEKTRENFDQGLCITTWRNMSWIENVKACLRQSLVETFKRKRSLDRRRVDGRIITFKWLVQVFLLHCNTVLKQTENRYPHGCYLKNHRILTDCAVKQRVFPWSQVSANIGLSPTCRDVEEFSAAFITTELCPWEANGTLG